VATSLADKGQHVIDPRQQHRPGVAAAVRVARSDSGAGGEEATSTAMLAAAARSRQASASPGPAVAITAGRRRAWAAKTPVVPHAMLPRRRIRAARCGSLLPSRCANQLRYAPIWGRIFPPDELPKQQRFPGAAAASYPLPRCPRAAPSVAATGGNGQGTLSLTLSRGAGAIQLQTRYISRSPGLTGGPGCTDKAAGRSYLIKTIFPDADQLPALTL